MERKTMVRIKLEKILGMIRIKWTTITGNQQTLYLGSNKIIKRIILINGIGKKIKIRIHRINNFLVVIGLISPLTKIQDLIIISTPVLVNRKIIIFNQNRKKDKAGII